MRDLQDFQKLVISNAADAKGLTIGDLAPGLTLSNALGKEVSLSKII